MRRRSILKRSLALATVAVAGCSGDGSDDDPTETPTDEPSGGDDSAATDTMGAATATPGTETTAGGTRTTTGGATDTRSETPTGDGTTGTPPTETPTPTDGPTPTESETPTGTPTPTETETETPTPPQAAQSVEVGPESKFRFDPEEFEIAVGETVRWVWRGNGHNVKPDSIPDDSDWSGTEGSGSDTYDSGHEHTHTFETPGTYEYVCVPHESLGMRGSFTVTE